MSQSDRISIRPICFGTYEGAKRDDRGCFACLEERRCIQPSVGPSGGDPKPARSKYHREIRAKAVVDGREVAVSVWLDFYDIAKAWDVRCPALQHALKKILAPGNRGHKDLMTDLNDIVQSAIRAQELEQ